MSAHGIAPMLQISSTDDPLDREIKSCAAHASRILMTIDPLFTMREDHSSPEQALFSYAQAILRRRVFPARGVSLQSLADLYSERSDFDVLREYLRDGPVNTLKLLTTDELVSWAKPEHKIIARAFARRFHRYFSDGMTPSESAMTRLSKFEVLEPVEVERCTVHLEDGTYSINCSRMFTSGNSNVTVWADMVTPGARQIFNQSAVLHLLVEWGIEASDVKTINLSYCCLVDEDIKELQLLLAGLPACQRLDISHNRFLTFPLDHHRLWFANLLNRMQVILFGNARLLAGEKALLRFIATTFPDNLTSLVWIGRSLVQQPSLWGRALHAEVPTGIIEACVSAHVEYYNGKGDFLTGRATTSADGATAAPS